MTQEAYGYATLGIWLTMVAVAAAGLWPRRSDKDREAPDTNSVQTRRAVATPQRRHGGS
jgi:hypothetical protein